MAFGVHSEVGKLRKVMVHRPGLEHTRLTPSNAEELLFDDVLWVHAGQAASTTRSARRCASAGVEVFEAETLLAEALAEPDGQRVGRRAHPRTSARSASAPPRGPGSGSTRPRPPTSPTSSSAASPAATSSSDVGLVWQSGDPTAMLLPPLPNFLFQRDPSCWIFDGVTLNPMTKPARKPETMIMRGHLPVPPDVHRRGSSRSGSAAPTRTGAAATSRAATSSPSATAR